MNNKENFTKEYFDQRVKDFVTKDYFSEKTKDFVTKKYFDEKLDKRFSDFKVEMIRETRAMLYLGLSEHFENAKAYHQKETERYIGAIMEKNKDDMRAYYDQIRTVENTGKDHEKRITKLEWSVNGV